MEENKTSIGGTKKTWMHYTFKNVYVILPNDVQRIYNIC